MKSIFKKCLTIALITSLFAITATDMSSADSSEFSTIDRTTEFLSSVIGLDMTKYSLVLPSPPPGYENITLPKTSISDPTDVDGLLDVDAPSYDFESSEGTLETMSIFCNGHLKSLKIYSQHNPIYSAPLPTDILNQARSLLKSYQTFVSKEYALDSSFLVPMQDILNSVTDLSPTNTIAGNINFQVSKSGDKTRVQWIYTDNDITMDRKRVDISFRNNTFLSFRDTWSLYKVGGSSVLSSEEATKIALEAAQRVELQIGHADGTSEAVKVPDLSNAPYDVNFAMLPYHGTEDNFPSKLSRDPLTLYPYWQFWFYFNETIGGCIGVQVGVWGDTKEIIYASGYGLLGVPNMLNDQAIEEQKQLNLSDHSFLAVAIMIALMLAISISVIVLRRRNQRNC